MAMHNPRFPRIRPLALSLLLACGAGASLPAVAGITCVVEHSEDGTQDTGCANTGTDDDSTTACGHGSVATVLVSTAFGTNAEATGGPSVALCYDSLSSLSTSLPIFFLSTSIV